MNFVDFKLYVAALPDELSDQDFAVLENDFKDLVETRRAAVEDELSQTLARVAALQAKLGKPAQVPAQVAPAAANPPPIRPPRAQPSGDFTDADLGSDADDDGEEMTQGAFLAGLREARASGAAKREKH